MSKKLNIIAFYVSQYVWTLYILIPILITFAIQQHTDRSLIHSSNIEFDKTKNPTILAHLSDTHVNYIALERVGSFKKSVRILEKIKPELVILTGDIVDNFDFISFPRYGDQHEENWKLYKESLIPLLKMTYVDIPGNHDMYGIRHLFSPKNFLLNYSRSFNRSNVKSLSDFHVKSFLFENLNLTIITYNPFFFPTAHPSLHYFQYVTANDLDQIENILQKSKTNNILISHYPVGLLYSNRSSLGKKFVDYVGSDQRILAYLSGHTHPETLDVVHHGNGGIELIGPCNYEFEKFGVITIDNGCLSWSVIDAKNPKNGVISYPSPVSQLTSKTIFNDIENAEIRVVMFSDRNDLSISFTITGESTFSGKLQFSRTFLNQTKSLYVFPLKDCITRKGNYTITFSGDFEDQLDFVISDTYVVGGEINPEKIYTNRIAFITYPIFFFALILITFPNKWNVTFDEIEEWIETSDPEKNYWYFVIFFGIFLVRNRFQKAPTIVRYIVFISIFISFVFPILIFETEGVIGFIWSFGYVIDGNFLRTNWGVYFVYIYLAIVCLPMVSLCSSFALKNRTTLVATLDSVIVLLFIGGILYFLIVTVHEAAGSLFLYSCFAITPIFYAIVIIIWRIYENSHPSDDNENSLLQIDQSDSIN